MERDRLVLASSSPRRHQILERLGVEFTVHSGPDIEQAEEAVETAGMNAIDVASARALAKARASAFQLKEGTVIGVDTVVDMEGLVLGKPTDRDTAIDMLKLLRGRDHRVVTAVTMVDGASGESVSKYQVTHVTMRDYGDEEIRSYIQSQDFLDKAGSYGIQDASFSPVLSVKGCYLNVVGLPVCLVVKMLHQLGIALKIPMVTDWPEISICPECVKSTSQCRSFNKFFTK